MRLFTALLLFLSLAWDFSNAQGLDVKDPLQGTWRIQMDIQKAALMTDRSAKYDSLEDFQKESLMLTLSSRVYHFGENGFFESTWVSGGSSMRVQGLWEFDGLETLSIDVKSGRNMQYRVEFLKEGIALHPLKKRESVNESIYLTRLGK